MRYRFVLVLLASMLVIPGLLSGQADEIFRLTTTLDSLKGRDQIPVLLRLAELYIEKDPQISRDYSWDALNTCRETGDSLALASAITMVARSSWEMGMTKSALEYASKGLDAALASGDLTSRAALEYLLYDIYSGQGNTRDALKHLETHLKLKTTLDDAENERQENISFKQKSTIDSLTSALKNQADTASEKGRAIGDLNLLFRQTSQMAFIFEIVTGLLIILLVVISLKWVRAKKDFVSIQTEILEKILIIDTLKMDLKVLQEERKNEPVPEIDIFRDSHRRLQDILGHAEQGYLWVGPDLKVDPVYSPMCAALLGEAIHENEFPTLIFRKKEYMMKLIRNIFLQVFTERDPAKLKVYLDMMRKDVQSSEYPVKLEYRFISRENEKPRILVILTPSIYAQVPGNGKTAQTE